jgi:hypothetical protein
MASNRHGEPQWISKALVPSKKRFSFKLRVTGHSTALNALIGRLMCLAALFPLAIA